MKSPAAFRAIGIAALTTFVFGVAFAQTPDPQPTPQPETQPTADAPASDAMPVPPPPSVVGEAWIVMDAASGNVLAG